MPKLSNGEIAIATQCYLNLMQAALITNHLRKKVIVAVVQSLAPADFCGWFIMYIIRLV
jgi:hypothetical protein